MHSEYASSELVQLTYDPGMQAWIGNVTLPSPAYEGVLAPLGLTSFTYSGPYDVYVTGITADGVLTTTDQAAQQSFYIQPYVLVDGGNVTSLAQSSRFAFSGTTIKVSGTLDGDLFLGTDVVQGGTVTITGSRIQGTLDVRNANVTLAGVSGGGVSATNSTLYLKDSSIGGLSLSGSKVVLLDSSYGSVSPALPRLTAAGLSGAIGGEANYNVTVEGSGLDSSSLVATIDGAATGLQVRTASSGLTATGTINATSLNDGVHALVLTATQSDGLASSITVYFSTYASARSLSAQLSQDSAAITSIQGQLSSSKSSLNTLYLVAFVLAAIAIVGVAVGAFALVRRRNPIQGLPSS
jgi:hypothetical protein